MLSLKNVLSCLIVTLILLNVSLAVAENLEDEYDLYEIIDVPVDKVITCTNYYDGSWDHSVYHQGFVVDGVTHNFSQPRLIIISHGVDMGNNYSYKIAIHGQQRADYAEAIEEVLQRWESEGYLKGKNYNSILLHTCFSGRAKYQSYTLTNFHKMSMAFANDNRDVNAYSERYENGKMYLTLYTCRPKSRVIGLDGRNSRPKFPNRNIKICGF